jgi:hypothetical protein
MKRNFIRNAKVHKSGREQRKVSYKHRKDKDYVLTQE